MIQIFSADGTDGWDQPKVVQEVLADLKRTVFYPSPNDFDDIDICLSGRTLNFFPPSDWIRRSKLWLCGKNAEDVALTNGGEINHTR